MIELELRERGLERFCDLDEGLGGRAVGVGHGDGEAAVAAFADFGVKGDFAEEGNGLAGGFGAAAAVAEDFDAFAAGGGEVAHVLDDAEDGDIDFVEHADAFADDAEAGFLGSGDDDAAIEGNGLAKGKLGVAGAGREIDEEVIEIAPGDGGDELLDGFLDHGAAPDDGVVALDEEAHGHEFDAVVLGRDELFVFADGGFFVDAHHERDAGAVDVAVEQADAGAKLFEGAGEIDRDGGFADAAFAAGDGDDVADAGHAVLLGKGVGRAGGGAGAGPDGRRVWF